MEPGGKAGGEHKLALPIANPTVPDGHYTMMAAGDKSVLKSSGFRACLWLNPVLRDS